MDIAHLKTFLEIYRVRHFGRAAERLFITQSAASARIKLLEEQLGIQLFARSHGSVTPTPAGQRLLKYAESVVANWEQAMQNVGLPETFQQSLRIGCLPDIWNLSLRHDLARVCSILPQSALYLSIHPGKLLIEQVLHGTLEIGIAFEPVQTPVMTHQALAVFELVLVSTQQSSPEVAMADHYTMVDWGTAFQVEYAHHFRHEPRPVLHVNSGMMALDILQQQGGSAYLPRQVLEYSGQTKLYQLESAPVFRRDIYAVYRQDSAHNELIQTLIGVLKSREEPRSKNNNNNQERF